MSILLIVLIVVLLIGGGGFAGYRGGAYGAPMFGGISVAGLLVLLFVLYLLGAL